MKPSFGVCCLTEHRVWRLPIWPTLFAKRGFYESGVSLDGQEVLGFFWEQEWVRLDVSV